MDSPPPLEGVEGEELPACTEAERRRRAVDDYVTPASLVDVDDGGDVMGMTRSKRCYDDQARGKLKINIEDV